VEHGWLPDGGGGPGGATRTPRVSLHTQQQPATGARPIKTAGQARCSPSATWPAPTLRLDLSRRKADRKSMDIRAVAFDVNGTLVRILTEDDTDQIFRTAAHFLTYQGIDLHRHQVRDLYFQMLKEQQQASRQEHPEFDAVDIWRGIIEGHLTDFTRSVPSAKLDQLPLFLAEVSRGIARRRLHLYPHVHEVLDVLRACYPLALVTDAQSAYARAELHKVGLLDYFDPIIVSGDHGYRKPDRRLFQFALDGLRVAAENVLFVGNDMYRDIFGARRVGMQTVLFDSDQGTKVHLDCVPDYTITDLRDLKRILDLL
jgi:putative hydrolase of the HAD superfamily